MEEGQEEAELHAYNVKTDVDPVMEIVNRLRDDGAVRVVVKVGGCEIEVTYGRARQVATAKQPPVVQSTTESKGDPPTKPNFHYMSAR